MSKRCTETKNVRKVRHINQTSIMCQVLCWAYHKYTGKLNNRSSSP